ncbi:ATP-dependent zinc protease [Salinisphaera sp. SPP-AMP-43]|uniref:ATP-dependent zinc protease family protein n=1 Tax=Salinisphaera sp. SPP-AMP-43 TaxID=3121288 RepID=UPI003C6E9862
MSDHQQSMSDKTVIGWREWVSLPDLGIDAIKAKIDTGARTSALHTFSLDTGHERGERIARFGVHPYQGDTDRVVWCQAPIVDERNVRDSGGHREWRYVIATDLAMGARRWTVEITLTARDTMLFRMLVGRTAMAAVRVDPTASFLTGQP